MGTRIFCMKDFSGRWPNSFGVFCSASHDGEIFQTAPPPGRNCRASPPGTWPGRTAEAHPRCAPWACPACIPPDKAATAPPGPAGELLQGPCEILHTHTIVRDKRGYPLQESLNQQLNSSRVIFPASHSAFFSLGFSLQA